MKPATVRHLSAASTSCCRGPTSTAASASAPTRISPTRRRSPTTSARAASASAAPSTCSSARAGFPSSREMILADNEKDRRAALDELLPLQRADFYGVFKEMHGSPVTIRTIDPPLHEFLPKREDLMVEIARLEAAGKKGTRARREEAAAAPRRAAARVQPDARPSRRAARHHAIPEITEMQARAIMEAACQLAKEGGKVVPEIMIPLVGDVRELRDQKAVVVARRRGGHEGAGRQGEVPRRHDDRSAARRDHRRRDRAARPTSSRSARTT